MPGGGRNDELRVGLDAGQWVAAGTLDRGAVEEALYAAAERDGLSGLG
jgi:hypothetical protein